MQSRCNAVPVPSNAVQARGTGNYLSLPHPFSSLFFFLFYLILLSIIVVKLFTLFLSDSSIVFYQASTNSIWEFWQFRRDAISGALSASWGGCIFLSSPFPHAHPSPPPLPPLSTTFSFYPFSYVLFDLF